MYVCMYNSIGATLDLSQPKEQAGFRSGYSASDHLSDINQADEK